MGSGHSEAWLRAVRLSKPFPQNTLSARLEVKAILSLNGHLLGCTQRLHTGEGENGNMSPAMWTVCDNAGTSHQWAQCPVAGLLGPHRRCHSDKCCSISTNTQGDRSVLVATSHITRHISMRHTSHWRVSRPDRRCHVMSCQVQICLMTSGGTVDLCYELCTYS